MCSWSNVCARSEREVTWTYRCEVWEDDVQGWTSKPKWSNLANDEAHALAVTLRREGKRVRIIGDYTSG